MVKVLHIRFSQLQLLHQNGIEESYFSVSHNQRHHFSSTFTHARPTLSDDVIIPLHDDTPPQSLWLHRWESCIVIFNFEMELPDLKARPYAKRKIETRSQEFLTITMHLLPQRDFMFTSKHLGSIAQHYLIVEDIEALGRSKGVVSGGPSYFVIKTDEQQYQLPVRESYVALKLPSKIEIFSFVNDTFNGGTKRLTSEELSQNQEIELSKQGSSTGKIRLKLRWGVNLHRYSAHSLPTLDLNEVLLYDFQLKFDNPADVAGCHFKVMQNSRAFEFTQEIDQTKMSKIKKIIHFVAKSEADQIDFMIQKKDRVMMQIKVSLLQIAMDSLTVLRRKWNDPNNPGKSFGYIKAKAERGRNVSIPQSNRQWRDCLKNRQSATSIMLTVSQASVYFPNKQHLVLVSKVEKDQKLIRPVMNVNYFNPDDQPSPQVLQFPIKGGESVYLMLKGDPRDAEFEGIGVVNAIDLRLGCNACEVPLFRNQEKAGVVNCLINKFYFWQFIKVMHQPQPPPQIFTPAAIDIFLTKIALSPYYHTYQYDNKHQLYCIVEVNRHKKVLILEPQQHDGLSFTSAVGSDNLDYTVEQDSLKVKFTFLVSDLGVEEEVYGIAVCKTRVTDLNKQQIKFKGVQIKNQHDVPLGVINLEVSRSSKAPVVQQPSSKVKVHYSADRRSFASQELSQASFDTRIIPTDRKKYSPNPGRRYSSSGSYHGSAKPEPQNFLRKHTHPYNPMKEIKLPVINEKKKKEKDHFKELIEMMKVRKRGTGGTYQSPNQEKSAPREVKRQHGRSFDLKKIEQTNPNIDRNLQILFPRKGNQKQILQSRARYQAQNSRLRNFKSVMDQIGDVGQVEPSIRQSVPSARDYGRVGGIGNGGGYYPTQQQNQQPEWEGNQFA